MRACSQAGEGSVKNSEKIGSGPPTHRGEIGKRAVVGKIEKSGKVGKGFVEIGQIRDIGKMAAAGERIGGPKRRSKG